MIPYNLASIATVHHSSQALPRYLGREILGRLAAEVYILYRLLTIEPAGLSIELEPEKPYGSVSRTRICLSGNGIAILDFGVEKARICDFQKRYTL